MHFLRATPILFLASLTLFPRVGAAHQPSQQSNVSPSALPQDRSPELLDTLLRVGYGGEEDALDAIRELDERIDAVEAIRELYDQSSKNNTQLRWLALNTLAALQAERSAEFLAQIALRPLPLPVPPNPSHEHHPSNEQGCSMAGINGDDADYLYPEWGAGALAAKVARSGYASQNLQRLMKQVLKYADPKIAKAAAGSLFGQHALRKSHKKILDARGIFSDFRFLTPEEQAELFDVSKINNGSPSEVGDTGERSKTEPENAQVESDSTASPNQESHASTHTHTHTR